MRDEMYTESMCTHRLCVCVYVGPRTCPGTVGPRRRNRYYSASQGRLHFHHGSGVLLLVRCCCIVCIQYNYIHTYIRGMYVVCNQSVHNLKRDGVAS